MQFIAHGCVENAKDGKLSKVYDRLRNIVSSRARIEIMN